MSPRLAVLVAVAVPAAVPGQPPLPPAARLVQLPGGVAVPSRPPVAAAVGDELPDGAVRRLGTTRYRHARTGGQGVVSADGRFIAAPAGPNRIRVLKAATGETAFTATWAGPATIASWPAFSADGSRLVVAHPAGFTVYDTATGREVRAVADDRPQGVGVPPAVNRDGTRVAVAVGSPAGKAKVRVFDVAADRPVCEVEPEFTGSAHVALSDDGKVLAIHPRTLSQPARPGPPDPPAGGVPVTLYDADTGKELRQFTTGGRQAAASRFSPDGKLYLTAAAAEPLELWEVATGKRVRTFLGRTAVGQVAAFSPDGKTLAAGSPTGLVQLWEVASGKSAGVGECPDHSVYGVAFPAGGPAVAIGSAGATVQLWEVPGGRRVNTVNGHAAEVTTVRFGPDGRHMFTLDADALAVRWDAATGAAVGSARVSGLVGRPRPSSTGTAVYVGPFHPNSPQSAAFSPDGTRLVAPNNYGGLTVFDPATGDELFALPGGGRVTAGSPGKPTFSADGRRVAHGGMVYGPTGASAAGCCWELATGRLVGQLGIDPEPNRPVGGTGAAAALTPDGSRLAVAALRYANVPGVGGSRYAVAPQGVNLATGIKSGWSESPIDQPQLVLVPAADNRTFLIPAAGKRYAAWDAVTGKVTRTLAVEAVPSGPAPVFAPDGRTFVAAGATADRTVLRVVEWVTGGVRAELPVNGSAPAAVAFSPDGKTLAVGWGDTTVVLFDVSPATGPRPWEKTPTDPGKLWDALERGDAPAGWAAVRELAGRPDAAVELLRAKLDPAPAEAKPDAAGVAKLIADLDAPAFADREAAGQRLRELDRLVEAEVRAALATTGSPEAKRRLEKLADALDKPTPPHRAEARAVEVLERIGTPAAVTLLKDYAGGRVGAPLTVDAAAALRRLGAK